MNETLSAKITLDEIRAESLAPKSYIISPHAAYGGVGAASNLSPRYRIGLCIESREMYDRLIIGADIVLKQLGVSWSFETIAARLCINKGDDVNKRRQANGLEAFPQFADRWTLRFSQFEPPFLRHTQEEQDGTSISQWLHRDNRHDMRKVKELFDSEVFAEVRIKATLRLDEARLLVKCPQLHWRERYSPA